MDHDRRAASTRRWRRASPPAGTSSFVARRAGVNNVVYPALISPAWWPIRCGRPTRWRRRSTSSLMTAAAIPLFLWARKLVSPVCALVAVALTLLLPAFVYTGMLMTENAFLPAFVLAAFAIAAGARAADAAAPAGRVRRDPARRRDPLPGPGPAGRAADGDPAQGPVRASRRAATAAAGASCGASSGDTGSRGACSWPEPLLYVAAQVARGRSLSSGLGSYQVVAGGYSFGEVRHWVLLHFAEFLFRRGDPGLVRSCCCSASRSAAAGRAARPSGHSSP